MQKRAMQKSLIVILGGILLLLGGCACFSGHNAFPVLPSPQATLMNKRITQLVKIDTEDQSETFIAVLELHTDKTQLIGLTTTGITLFTLEYTSSYQELNVAALYSNTIKPMQLLTELQLVNYSTDKIKQQLPENWSLDTKGEQNYLLYKDKTRIKASFFTDLTNPGPITVNNMADGHTLTISRLNIEDTQ